jgi:hypothetical protein
VRPVNGRVDALRVEVQDLGSDNLLHWEVLYWFLWLLDL